MKKKTVVLLSGGLDSSVVLSEAIKQKLLTITFLSLVCEQCDCGPTKNETTTWCAKIYKLAFRQI